ncbi:hypothetical protein FLONG3_5588 [Fusarium longipes]|uniref:Uncharacterized protein n=1 Tax=Fusarium longipes TaxID=694270 RepID=A0A395STM9_9HYPO|nr:hypothetical protein FLONG3_5588 [Fusarium longipes]
MINYLWRPPRGPPGDKRPRLDKRLPENFKYFENWGFTIYRTYYGAESDEHWNTLLEVLRQQTLLALGYHETEEARERERRWKFKRSQSVAEDLEQISWMKKLFRLFPREDPSLLEGLDIHGIRELAIKEHAEAEKKLLRASWSFVLVADEAVLKDIARCEFVVKAVGYDWHPTTNASSWGWVRISTGDLLELWEILLVSDVASISKYVPLRFKKPEEGLEIYLWQGDDSMPYFSDFSKVQTKKYPYVAAIEAEPQDHT